MKKIYQNQTLISLTDQAMLSGSNFLLGVCVAKLLGIQTFGEYALLTLYTMLAMGFVQSFIISPMQQISANANHNVFGYLKQVHLLQVVISLVFAGILVTYFLVNKLILLVSPWVLFAFIFIILLNETNRKALYIIKYNLLILITSFISNIIPLTIISYLYAVGTLTLNNALLIQSIFYAIGISIGSFPLLFKSHTKSYSFVLKEHFNKSVWLTSTSLLQWFSGNIFMIAASQLLGNTALGAIKMAQNLLGLLNVLLLALENHFPSKVAQLFLLETHHELLNYLKSFFKQYLLASALLLLSLSLFAKTIVYYMFGPSFISFTWVVYGFIAIYLIIIIATPIRIAIRVLNKQQTIFWGYLISTLFGFILAEPLVQKLGVTGVITGFGMGQVIMLLTYFIGFGTIPLNLPKQSNPNILFGK